MFSTGRTIPIPSEARDIRGHAAPGVRRKPAAGHLSPNPEGRAGEAFQESEPETAIPRKMAFDALIGHVLIDSS